MSCSFVRSHSVFDQMNDAKIDLLVRPVYWFRFLVCANTVLLFQCAVPEMSTLAFESQVMTHKELGFPFVTTRSRLVELYVAQVLAIELRAIAFYFDLDRPPLPTFCLSFGVDLFPEIIACFT